MRSRSLKKDRSLGIKEYRKNPSHQNKRRFILDLIQLLSNVLSEEPEGKLIEIHCSRRIYFLKSCKRIASTD
jgi:hypothetical protein